MEQQLKFRWPNQTPPKLLYMCCFFQNCCSKRLWSLNGNCSQPLLIQMTDVWTTRKDSSDVASSDVHPQQLLPDTYSTCNEKGASQPFAVKHSYG